MNPKIQELYNTYTKEQLQSSLSDACCIGRIDNVKYLLEVMNVDINFNCEEPFREACKNSNLEIVKYLLTSKTLKKHTNINNCSEDTTSGLTYACTNGDLDMVKYLLTSHDLKEHANIHANNDSAFKLAFYREESNVLEYLIFDYKIPYTNQIKNYMPKIRTYNGNENYHEQIEKMFLTRELNDELSFQSVLQKKVKI